MPPPTMYIDKYSIDLWKDKDQMLSNVTKQATRDFVHYDYNITDQKGEFYFSISPKTSACGAYGCYRSVSPVIDLTPTSWILIAIIVAVIIIFIVIGIIICCCCKGGAECCAWATFMACCCSD